MDGLVSLHDTISFTHICSPHLSKFLTLYGVTVLIIFYPTNHPFLHTDYIISPSNSSLTCYANC